MVGGGGRGEGEEEREKEREKERVKVRELFCSFERFPVVSFHLSEMVALRG